MYQITVVYNHPTDAAAFDSYYRSTHIPLVGRIPDLSEATFVKCESLDGSQPGAYAVARLTFASKETALAALGSDAGQAASGDVANFADGGATLLFSGDPEIL